jgi:hypothetical protein
MGSTFEEAGARALLERFKRELKTESISLDEQAEMELADLVQDLLAKDDQPERLLGEFYHQLPLYVGRFVARGLVRRRKAGMQVGEPVVLAWDDALMALAGCALCPGLSTPPTSASNP